MPEKNNFLLRLKARNALRGHWQTALLMMMLGSLVSWAAQAVSTIQGNTVLQQLTLAMQRYGLYHAGFLDGYFEQAVRGEPSLGECTVPAGGAGCADVHAGVHSVFPEPAARR